MSETAAVTAALGVVGIGVAHQAVTGHPPTARQVVGAVVFLVLVSGLASASPQLGTGVAVLALTTTVLVAGPTVLAAITRTTTGKSTP